ncbi:MAG: acyltransferase domain-containing protein [Betaproteobacteria bacterium]
MSCQLSVALLFPGQGTQHEAMLPWLEGNDAARPLLAALAREIGADWRARLGDVEWAQSNRVAQRLVTGVSVAAWAALAPHLPRVVAVAGYSVGELAARAAAGMLAPASALALAALRADAMDACAVEDAAGLLGLSNVTAADVEDACARWGLEVAIRTGADRCIVGGRNAALAQAASHLAARGAKATLLGVRVASHTSAMRAAVPVVARALASVPWHAPRVAWVAGTRGAVVRDPGEARGVLAEQVATVIRWDACMDTIAERRPDCVLEVGPGTTLARLWRERLPDVPVRSCDEFQGVAEIAAWVAGAVRR